MAVTELALFRLKSPQDISPNLKTGLKHGQCAQTEYSGYQLRFLHQIEDPAYIYLLGGWESVAAHCNDWIPSEVNQKLMTQIKSDVDLEWMFHLNIDPTSCIALLHAPIIAITRYFIQPGKKAEFEATFSADKHHLSASTAPYPYAGGWREDKMGQDEEEFVLFSGWNNVEHHFKFVGWKGSKELAKTKELVRRVEIKHALVKEWE